MKKILLFSAISVLALSACTSEEVIEEGPQSDAITFKNVVNKSSRSMDNSNFTKFFVSGYYTTGTTSNTIFNNNEVSREAIDKAWTTKSSDTRYWIQGANYNFFAFSCENANLKGLQVGSAQINDGDYHINYTLHKDPETGNSHDLIFASTLNVKGLATDNPPVSLQFKHILSKISFKFISDFPQEYKLEITEISISDFKNEGTFNAALPTNEAMTSILTGSWSGVDMEDPRTPPSFALTTDGNKTELNVKDANGNQDYIITQPCYVMPCEYSSTNKDAQVKLNFTLKIINSKDQQIIINKKLIGAWLPKWYLGTQYLYTVKLSGSQAGMEAIKFTAEISDWNEPSPTNQPQDINFNFELKSDQD